MPICSADIVGIVDTMFINLDIIAYWKHGQPAWFKYWVSFYMQHTLYLQLSDYIRQNVTQLLKKITKLYPARPTTKDKIDEPKSRAGW